MLPVAPYPRRAWSRVVGIVGAVFTAGILLGYGIPTGIHMHTVISAQSTAETHSEANHFWRMVAGTDPTDNSDLGRVAAKTRELGRSEPSPIRALMEHYVAPGALPDLDDRLGYHAFEAPDPDRQNGTVTDRGKFTPRFVLDAIQALGLVPGSSANDLMKPVPEVPSYGLLRWEYGVAGLVGLWTIAGSVLLVLRRDRRRWPQRAEAQAIRELTDDEREVYRIIVGLQREPRGEQRDELLKQAKALFQDMRRGLDSPDQLAKFRAALDEAGSAWQFKRQAYDEIIGQ